MLHKKQGKKIIFASSAAVYGDSKKNPINENGTTSPQSPYGQSKLDAEKVIVKTCKENEIDHVIFRMFNVYGKGQNKQYAGVITKFLGSIRDDKQIVIYGDGEQTRDFVSVNDVTYAFDCAIRANSSGTYNIASGRSVSIKGLAKMILDMSEKEIEIEYKSGRKEDIRYSNADIALAKKELEFSPKVSLKEGLSDLISVPN